MTDQQSQQKINQAADQFTDALVQSYKTVAERGVSAQEGSAQVTEVFFNQTINNLRAQAEENRQAAERLADQQQRQAEAVQTLTRESVGAYMEFMDSMFSYWQGGIQTAEQGAREIEKATKGEKS
jgi:predicted nucleic acid-binding protein